MRRDWLIAGIVVASLPAAAQNTDLIPGPGAGLTTAKCVLCHDGAHVTRSKLTREEWDENLKTMLKRGMPPLTQDETRVILEYLSAYYGPNPPPAPSPDTLAAPQSADPIARLLDTHLCAACHKVDEKLVGPSFRDVASRYAGDGGAATRLAAKIRGGGSGAWGPAPMPGNSALSDAEIKTLVGWVLGQK